MNALFDLLTKSELALELDAAVLELDAAAARATALRAENARLREAVEDALVWLDFFGMDAPYAFSKEQEIRDTLQAALAGTETK